MAYGSENISDVRVTRLLAVLRLTSPSEKRYIGIQREGRIQSTVSIQKKFTEALDDLVAQIRQDRSILAAVLCGSL
jgi:hypothetical protein